MSRFCFFTHHASRITHHASRITHHASRITHHVSLDRKSTRLNSSHSQISYAVFCLKKKKTSCIAHYSDTAPSPKYFLSCRCHEIPTPAFLDSFFPDAN